MKYNESIQKLHHSWADICSVFYRRYPNPHSKHVLGEDIVHRTIGVDHILKTTRIFAKTNEVPSWLSKFLPTSTVYILEESHIDIKNNLIVTYTRNLTHKTLLSVEEKCIFSADRDMKDCTEVRRQAWIESFFIGLSPVFERFGLSRYKSNIQRMHRGFDSVLGKENVVSRISTSSANPSFIQSDVHLPNGIKSVPL